MKKALFTLLIITYGAVLTWGQSVYFVNTSATGNNTGLSWANAFTDLQTALQTASAGDEIWVAKGVYYPTQTTDRYISFVLKPGIRLMGGFMGIETQIAERDAATHITTLSGNIGAASTKLDNSKHVVYASNLDDNTRLDGFTIADGYSEDEYGAGLFINEDSGNTSHPVIEACRLATIMPTLAGLFISKIAA